jgi:hypothetical protein
MRTVTGTVALAAVLFAVLPGAGHTAQATPDPQIACDVRLNVIDHDPKGLNVRTTPEVRADNVRTVLRQADWIRVHVIGMTGDWYLIDGAERWADDNSDGDQVMPPGRTGWVHKSKLGGVRGVGRGALYGQPNARGKPFSIFNDDESKIAAMTVLGCQGEWLHVKMGGATGWTRNTCSNQRTTCV